MRHGNLFISCFRPTRKKRNSRIKSLYLFVFSHKKYSRCLINLCLSHCSHGICKHFLHWPSGPSSFDPLECLCSSDPPLKFNKKYLHLCSEDEQRSYGVGTAWGWVINDFIFGWTNPLKHKINAGNTMIKYLKQE